MTQHLDPVAFPFTADELRAAVALMVPAPEVDALLTWLLELIETTRASRLSAAAARSRGSTDPEEINEATLILPDELYAALGVATPSCAPRVEVLLEEWRAQTRQARQRDSMYQAGLHPLAPPTQTVIAMLDEQEATARAAWDAVKARMAARQHGA